MDELPQAAQGAMSWPPAVNLKFSIERQTVVAQSINRVDQDSLVGHRRSIPRKQNYACRISVTSTQFGALVCRRLLADILEAVISVRGSDKCTCRCLRRRVSVPALQHRATPVRGSRYRTLIPE